MARFPKIVLTSGELTGALEFGTALWKAKGENYGATAKSDNFIVDSHPEFRSQVAAIAETAWELFSGEKMCREIWEGRRGDGGSDFPGGNNVKGSAQKNKPELMIPVRDWERQDLKVKKYTLIWILKDDLRICKILGEISREEFELKKAFKPGGYLDYYCDTYMMQSKYLHPIKKPLPEQGNLF